jgi:hypothetical protein
MKMFAHTRNISLMDSSVEISRFRAVIHLLKKITTREEILLREGVITERFCSTIRLMTVTTRYILSFVIRRVAFLLQYAGTLNRDHKGIQSDLLSCASRAMHAGLSALYPGVYIQQIPIVVEMQNLTQNGESLRNSEGAGRVGGRGER